MVALAGAAAVVLVLAGVWYFSRPEPVPEEPPAAEAPPPAVEAPPAAAPEPPPPEPERPARTPRRPKPEPKVEPPPPEEPAVTLRIESDVPGAMVFLDRQFLGNAPVTTSEVQPGEHVLNASAEGYPGLVEKVQVIEGDNEVMLRFRVVRLNESITVVHKHTFGSCEGRLAADTSGLRYETTNAEHRFSVPFDQLETFEVDYLEKNLKVKIKGGRTYNFTDRNDNADALFVFHKNVEDARARLARGDAPVK